MCIELFDQSGNSLMLSQDEWHAIRYMAQDRGWSPLGSHHPDIPGWRGSYLLSESQQFGEKDLMAFKEAVSLLDDLDSITKDFITSAGKLWIC